MGASLSRILKADGLLPAEGCAAKTAVVIRADGHDQRTRASAAALAQRLEPGCGLEPLAGPPDESDPLFDSSAICPWDPEAAKAAVLAEAGTAGLDTPQSRAALEAIQTAAAPLGCSGEGGPCLASPARLVATSGAVKLQGGLADGTTLAEIFLLEYAEGFAPKDVAWGAGSGENFIAAVMPAHLRASQLTRRTPYLAIRRGALLARAMLDALDAPASASTGGAVTIFVGHDTNLSNMAGLLGLNWRLPGEPDPTGPSVSLALEVWRQSRSGELRVRPVIYYQTLETLRTLRPAAAARVAMTFEDCADGSGCPLSTLKAALQARLLAQCPQALATP
jgi:4-phytase/acid phosphatase